MFDEALTRHGFHDPLTGLANRLLFPDRLEHALQRRRRRGLVAVLFGELARDEGPDDDAPRRPLGDDLLISAGKRLEVCLRPADTVARLGGDEFAVLLDEVDGPVDAAGIAERLIIDLQRPFQRDESEESAEYLNVSIGMAFGTPGKTHPGDVLRQADAALYRAREKGENRFAIFGPA